MMTKQDNVKINNLIKIMHQADKAYWNHKTNNIISDGEYDNLYMKLKAYKKKYPHDKRILKYFSTVQHDTTNTFNKRKQLYHVKSLDKIRTPKAVAHFLNKWNLNKNSLWYTKHFLIEKKNDGISAVLYFNDKRMGKPLVALTRGSGVAGADITPEVKYFKRMNIRQIMKNLHGRHLVVRGELLISHHDFKKLNATGHNKFENCRNLASGSVFNKDPKVAGQRGIFLSAYTILDRQDWLKQYPTELQQMKFLRDLGFNVIQDIHMFPNTTKGKQNVLHYMFDYSHPMREAIDHDIDGLVIKPNNTLNLAKIGWNRHGADFAKSYKFAPQQSLTQVKTIKYQISANGKLTPVIIFTHPVHIFGATISKCTGSSVGNMKKNHIMINGYITVKRMNDVIPKAYGVVALNQNLTNLKVPLSTMPKDAVKNGKFYYIPKTKMSNSMSVLINRWAKLVSKPCLNIKGLSNRAIKTMMIHHLINPHDFSSLWKIDKKKFIQTQGFGQKGWNNLQRQLKKAKPTPLPQIFLGLPIDNSGLSMYTPICECITEIAKKIYNHPYHYLFRQCIDDVAYRNNIRKLLIKTIPNIKGLGQASVPVIKSLFSNEIMQQLANLEPYLDMKDVQIHVAKSTKTTNITGKNFVITGSLSKPRKYFKHLIVKNGGTLKSGISSKVNYLICNQKSNSSKYKKALKRHIPIINETQFLKLLK